MLSQVNAGHSRAPFQNLGPSHKGSSQSAGRVNKICPSPALLSSDIGGSISKTGVHERVETSYVVISKIVDLHYIDLRLYSNNLNGRFSAYWYFAIKFHKVLFLNSDRSIKYLASLSIRFIQTFSCQRKPQPVHVFALGCNRRGARSATYNGGIYLIPYK